MEQISIRENESISKIMNQTNYSKEEALNRLRKNNGDYIKTIKEYLGVSEKTEKTKSLNQEIYRQIRLKLDDSMRLYREKNPLDINQIAENLQISEEKEKEK
jgi:coproporphyrinogen III oxidase-like Fe-S oxidoreductase